MEDEDELKSILKDAQIANSFQNISNKQNAALLKKKIDEIKSKGQITVEYPINIIYEIVLNTNEIYQHEQLFNELKKETENVIMSM